MTVRGFSWVWGLVGGFFAALFGGCFSGAGLGGLGGGGAAGGSILIFFLWKTMSLASCGRGPRAGTTSVTYDRATGPATAARDCVVKFTCLAGWDGRGK